METILFLAHTEADGTLAKASLEALSAAVNLSGAAKANLVVGLYGAQANVDAIGSCGAQKFLTVTGEEFSAPRYATDAAAAEALARASGATIVVAAGTSRNARVMAGVAHRLKGRIDTHIAGAEISGETLTINRWFYRQRIEGSLTRAERPWFLLFDAGSQPAWSGAASAVSAEAVAVPAVASRTKVTGVVTPAADKQTIRPDAKLLFVAGAGWTKKQKDGQAHVAEAEQLILGFLNASNASLGSSKSLVDLSGEGQSVLAFMSHMNQIGQTGSTPRHPKGLSTCCHGEEPHVVGWRFIGERRAINLDANCGWARGKADVLYVADAFEVMTKVNALLQK